MAYKASRSARLNETLELVDAKGSTVHLINIDLDVDGMAQEFNKRYNSVIAAEKAAKAVSYKEITEMTDEAAQAINNAVAAFGAAAVSLFKLIFGEENTAAILDFYENKYIEMCINIVPFITDVIVPKIKQSTKEAQTRLAENYFGQGKKPRRKTGF